MNWNRLLQDYYRHTAPLERKKVNQIAKQNSAGFVNPEGNQSLAQLKWWTQRVGLQERAFTISPALGIPMPSLYGLPDSGGRHLVWSTVSQPVLSRRDETHHWS